MILCKVSARALLEEGRHDCRTTAAAVRKCPINVFKLVCFSTGMVFSTGVFFNWYVFNWHVFNWCVIGTNTRATLRIADEREHSRRWQPNKVLDRGQTGRQAGKHFRKGKVNEIWVFGQTGKQLFSGYGKL